MFGRVADLTWRHPKAVARGIARTGRVITAAGVCLAAVFLAFTPARSSS